MAGRPLLGFALLVFAAVVLRRAWVSDDGFISLRVVDNLVGGYGLTFNPDERVQSFTNPLWVLVLALPHTVLREPFATCMVASIPIALAGVWLLVRMATSVAIGALVVLLLAFSQAYVDFSTSGLENPLTHLLVIGFMAIYLVPERRRRHGRWLVAIAALSAVNRLDSLPMFTPAVASVLLRGDSRPSPRAMLLGLTPLLGWLFFATLYYGFPIPNTAIAKLHVDLPRHEVWGQGLLYLFESLRRDPLTILALTGALAVGFAREDRALRAASLGLLLQLIYVVSVGGDFMLGRFLSAPLALAACILVRGLRLESVRAGLPSAAAALATLVILSPHCPLNAVEAAKEIPPSGVADERAWYVGTNGLLVNIRRLTYRQNGWFRRGRDAAAAGKQVVVHNNAGMVGYGAGPAVHVLERAGLADVFLARLPSPYRKDWRPGHFGRVLPQGYVASLEHDENRLKDPGLRKLYDKVQLVVSGPVFSLRRMVTAYHLLMGHYDRWIPDAET